MNYKEGLERNLWLIALMRVFHKRAYLAVIIIYATSVADVTLEQIGFIAGISALVSMIVEIPSGYISDRMGHKRALIFGSFFIMIAPLSFVFAPSFVGILFASLLYWVGTAFHSGTEQAFIHETLIELDRDREYGTIVARAQRWGLFGNIFLVALVPLLYTFDPTYPFIAGFVLQSGTFILPFFYTRPRGTKVRSIERVHDGFWALLKNVHSRREVLLFFFLGLIVAFHNKIPEYKELYFQEIGVPLWFFGFVYSLMGVAGIILSYQVPLFERLRARTFYILDFAIGCVICILVGIVSNPISGVVIFVILGGFYRMRRIVVNAFLLRGCPTKNLKATYLSMYQFFAQFNMIWIPVLLGFTVGHFGVRFGYGIFGLGALVTFIVLFLVVFYRKGEIFNGKNNEKKMCMGQ